jgi:putative ABC transport system permease protein
MAMMEQFEKTIAESMMIAMMFMGGFAAIIACGVVYDAARIEVSERGRELSTLRILGFTRGETATILLGEQAVLTAVALPIGCLLGFLLCAMTQPLYETEMYRMPIVVRPVTYTIAVTVAVLAALGSSLLVRRELDRLDMVAVLKAAD